MKEWFTGCPVNTMIQRRLRCVGWLLTWTVLGIVLSSCAPTFQKDITWGQRLGFRPDEPDFSVPTAATVCAAFKQYAIYSKQLKEAYRTRTTQNRTWIYVAGITGLAVAAASGALAAATAVAAGTLALLAISGGFTAASFATINNSELANVYNVAANDIGTALAAAEARVVVDYTPLNCAAQLATLVTLTAAITQIDGQDKAVVDVLGEGKLVTLTVVNAQLDKVAPSDIRVAVGPLEIGVDSISAMDAALTYEVKVRLPGRVSNAAGEYAPSLVVGRSKQRILSRSGLVLKYPAPPPATPQ